jgi:putative transposase
MTYPSIDDPSHLYFVTASVIGWKQLFRNYDYAMIVLRSLEWLRNQRRMKIFAFVVMYSHLHILIKPEGLSIGDLIRQFGSYTAHEIITRLKEEGQTEALLYFKQHRRSKRINFSIWQDIQAKNIYTEKYLWEKLEYIHNNPVAKEWRLVDDRADYQFSSACYYDRGIKPIIAIDDVRDFLGKI